MEGGGGGVDVAAVVVLLQRSSQTCRDSEVPVSDIKSMHCDWLLVRTGKRVLGKLHFADFTTFYSCVMGQTATIYICTFRRQSQTYSGALTSLMHHRLFPDRDRYEEVQTHVLPIEAVLTYQHALQLTDAQDLTYLEPPKMPLLTGEWLCGPNADEVLHLHLRESSNQRTFSSVKSTKT